MDAYDRTARLYPALVVAFPLSLLVVLVVTSLPQWWQQVTSLIVTSGLHILLLNIVRDLGERKQKALWDGWDGPPTTSQLRWRSTGNRTMLKQRHDHVSNATGTPLPSAEEELLDPALADEKYEAAVAILRQRTRTGDSSSLVRKENAQYGFRRNLFGCRLLGQVIAAAALIAVGILGWLDHSHTLDIPATSLVITPIASITWLIGWRFVITDKFVRRAGDRYAEALLNAAADIQPPRSS